MSVPNLSVGERRLSRARVASILAAHDERADFDRMNYYDSLDELAAQVRSSRNWAEGEIFVSAFEDDRYVILKQVAPSSCELATYTQNGFHDVLTGYRYGQDELVEVLQTYSSEKSAPSFTPSDVQVQAAQALLVAIAHEGTVRPVVEGYQKAILQKHQFKISEKNVCEGARKDEVIIEPKFSWLLSEEDFAIFHEESIAARDALGLHVRAPDNCPLLEAEHLRIDCENALIKTWKGHERFSALADVSVLEERKLVLDLTLGMLAPYMKDNARDMLKDFGCEPPSERIADNGHEEGIEP
jgi:hypothetical protein